MRQFLGVLLGIVVASVAGAQTSIGDWQLVRQVDPITDENRSYIYAEATEHPQYFVGSLVLRCDVEAAHGLETFFHADRYLGAEDGYTVIYRVDDAMAVTNRWSPSMDYESVFLPDRPVDIFIGRLLGGSRLVFRIEAFDGDVTNVMPIRGLQEALDALGCYVE